MLDLKDVSATVNSKYLLEKKICIARGFTHILKTQRDINAISSMVSNFCPGKVSDLLPRKGIEEMKRNKRPF